MARGRAGGGRSRMDLRRQAEAAEARDRGEGAEEVVADDTEEEDEDEEGEEEEGEEEGGEDAEAEASDDADDDAGDDDDEDAPKKKKAKKKPVAKPKKAAAPKKRTRAVKEVRRKAVWKVYDNGGKTVGTFPFPQKAEAEALLAAKIEEKKTTFYMLLEKEEITPEG